MTRKGYEAELECKKKLQSEFGIDNVIKVAIGSFGSDFIVVGKGELVKCVEVKQCHSKKYYPIPDEKRQMKRIKAFCDEHQIPGEVWIKYPNRGWVIKNVDELVIK